MSNTIFGKETTHNANNFRLKVSVLIGLLTTQFIIKVYIENITSTTARKRNINTQICYHLQLKCHPYNFKFHHHHHHHHHSYYHKYQQKHQQQQNMK
jgi:hypothetical protein